VKAVSADRAASVSWTGASLTGHPVTGYALQARKKGATTWSSRVLAASVRSYIWTALKNGTTYEFRVIARFAGTTSTRTSAIASVLPLTVWTSVEPSDYNTCAINSFGEVWCWGYGGSAVLGQGSSPVDTAVPVRISLPKPATQLAGTSDSMCALLSDATVECWGGNTFGQLGRGTTGAPLGPDRVLNLVGITSIAAGSAYVCATNRATTWCWGSNSVGQLAQPAGASIAAPIEMPATPDGNIVDVQAGSLTACGRTAVGSIWCWGGGLFGQIGNMTTTATNPTPQRVHGLGPGASLPTVGNAHACTLVYGHVLCWGRGEYGALGVASNPVSVAQPTPPTYTLPTLASISAGGDYNCGLDTSAGLWCFGDNGLGAMGIGSTSATPMPPARVWLPDGVAVTTVGTGPNHACAIDTKGALWCWGVNTHLELGWAAPATIDAIPFAVTRSV
jgi:alpha-tubulin suppressor-like RCC1 family protein